MQQLNAAPQQGRGQGEPTTWFPPGFHCQVQYQLQDLARAIGMNNLGEEEIRIDKDQMAFD
eukprot:1314499-Prorocentrum_lima.AAC.1